MISIMKSSILLSYQVVFFIKEKVTVLACPFAFNNATSASAMLNDETHQDILNGFTKKHEKSLQGNDSKKSLRVSELIKNIFQESSKKRRLQNCLSKEDYYSIGEAITVLSSAISSDVQRSHFLGGIVRLAAHDFMDFNKNSDFKLGSDGCLDFDDSENAGLEDIWCESCALRRLYDNSYSFMSKADFWIAAANEVIRKTSTSNELDLITTFQWGRDDNISCGQSSTRLPRGGSCSEVENAFIRRMGLTWRDAAALMGAHTLGRGDENNSGHHGIWVDEVEESLIFDRRYFSEILDRNWEIRNAGRPNQDWTWGRRNGDSPRFMLNTDMCLRFNIDAQFPCCSRNNDNDDNCPACLSYPTNHERREAANAVEEFGRGRNRNGDANAAFYQAFSIAWAKATKNGWTNLYSLSESCDEPTTSKCPNKHKKKCKSCTKRKKRKKCKKNCNFNIAKKCS